MLSTFTVTNLNNNGAGSLRAAIELANTDAVADTIEFASSVTGTITLLSALPNLSSNVILSGPGPSALTVARSSDPTTPEFRIFLVTAGAEVTIAGLTIAGGSVFASGGGGILNGGTLTVSNSALNANSATSAGIFGQGGGIYNGSGTLTVTNSTLSDNSAFEGGGIFNFSGTVTVSNSTLSNNSVFRLSDGSGGGIYNSIGTVTVSNSTLSGNSVFRLSDGSGGGIYNGLGTVTVTSSLFANSVGGNLSQESSASFLSGGHNLFSDAPAVPLDPTNLINTDPLLGPLADYGGPTQTMALLPGSPAIDGGLAVVGVTADQRGVPRPQGNAPDIGAFESRGFSLRIDSGNNQSTLSNSEFPLPLIVRIASPFGEPVADGRITFVGPTDGPSASFTGNPTPIDAKGLSSVIAMANGLGGPYLVTAQATGAAANLTFALENLLIPPTVVGLQRLGVHAEPTTLTLRFRGPLDPARVQNVANYQIVTLGGHGRGGRRVGHITRVRTALYDSAIDTVILHPARRLDLRNAYRLTVRGTAPGGLATPTGVLLDGANTGLPGSDFVVTISRETLAGSSRAVFKGMRHRWARQDGIDTWTTAKSFHRRHLELGTTVGKPKPSG